MTTATTTKAPPKGAPVSSDDETEPNATTPLDVLEPVRAFITRYVSVTDHQADILALWAAHTHSWESAECTPYLAITATGPGCGKTRLLETLELVVSNPWLTGRVTGPALARRVNRDHPTLLLDECDTVWTGAAGSQSLLRGVVNSGYRLGGRTSYASGPEGVIDLDTFCPKAFAGIGGLPATISDRSIRLVLRKRGAFDQVERLRQRDAREQARLPRMLLARFSAMNLDTLRFARPPLPPQLDDRAADCYEPLLAIADLVGGDWPKRAREAAVALSAHRKESDLDTTAFRLLQSCIDVFELLEADRLQTHTLIEWLLESDEWAQMPDGRKIDPIVLSVTLRGFGIAPLKIRFGRQTLQGYTLHEFKRVRDQLVPAGTDASTLA